MNDRPLLIGNCSGFLGDRMSAMREMVTGGALDVLTGDYLAELTMLILARARLKDPTKGYATTFLRQLEDCLGEVSARGVKLVVNAGGLNPAGCAQAVRTLAERLGVTTSVAHVEGDDVLASAADVLTANAYLGGWPITRALAGGADIVITGRCTDAAVVCGPAAWWHQWSAGDLDQLAGAVVIGHVLECGAQATGGNHPWFAEVPGLEHPGFPLAEVFADGSGVITKHSGTGGRVDVDTVTGQLLYELTGAAYLGPDVTTWFDSIQLSAQGHDRVLISGVHGTAPVPTLKVATTRLGGWRNSMTFVLTGLQIEQKAELVKRTLAGAVPGLELEWRLDRTDQPDADTQVAAAARLTVNARSSDPAEVGRAFSSAAVEMALSSYPGCTLTSPPGDGAPFGIYAAQTIPATSVTPVVVHADGSCEDVPDVTSRAPVEPRVGTPAPKPPGGPMRRVPLGTVAGARSGDKGGDATLGVWVRSDGAWPWLATYLTADRLRELLPETAELDITVDLLPNLRAVQFVIRGLLGEGVASSTRFDPQAKALGEWLRSRVVDVPEMLLSRT